MITRAFRMETLCRVVAADVAFSFKGRHVDVRQIAGTELGVNFVLARQQCAKSGTTACE